MAHKVSEPCKLWINEAIQDGIDKGKSYTAIGKEISEQISKYFEVYIPPETLKQTARRVDREQKGGTFVPPNAATIEKDTENQKKPPHRPQKYPAPPSKAMFNETNSSIEWARWTWNPVTGCLHSCEYCYARDIANRFYPPEINFAPHFWKNRLDAPFNTPLPDSDALKDRAVFVTSMGDLFGEWVPQEWIDSVLDAVRKSPQWTYLFLTKNPMRYINIDWPANAWVGATIDCQERVNETINAFEILSEKDKKPMVTFISFEPLKEQIEFEETVDFDDEGRKWNDLRYFDWIIIGGQSQPGNISCSKCGRSDRISIQPEWEWVEQILMQARQAGCAVYFKPNLTVVPKEFPVKK